MDLPNIVMGLLNDSETKKTLVTVAADGKTNLTNVKAIKLLKPSVIVLAQAAAKQLNKELLAHMDNGRLVSILCVSIKEEQRTAFQIVCSVREFQTSGPPSMRSFSTSYEHVILISMACGCSSQLILLTDQATLIVGNQRSRRVGATCFDIAHCLRYVMSFWPFKTLTYCKATTLIKINAPCYKFSKACKPSV